MTYSDRHPHRRESVHEYPRSPRVENCYCRIRVVLGDETVAETSDAKRVVEHGHPPVYYIPNVDIRPGVLWETRRDTPCGPKGLARFFDVVAGLKHARCAAWTYPEPKRGFEAIADHIAFYSDKMDGCFVDEERVRPEHNDPYGGWITSNIVGPFRRGPDTGGP